MELLAGLGCLAVAVGIGLVLVRMIVKSFQSGRHAPDTPTAAAAQRNTGVASSSSNRQATGVYSISVTIGGTERLPRREEARWVSAGEVVTIAGYAIGGGLVYVGKHLNPVGGWCNVEPALINPSLSIDDASCDWGGTQMPYWPCYADLIPECRAAYLRWLADGRKHPTVGIGYVFLFFYGLERRLLFDASKTTLPQGEKEAILAEVERLLTLYGQQASFRRYASDFVDFTRLRGETPAKPQTPPSTASGGPFPLSLRVGLGYRSAERAPISADWALAWMRSHPETRLRTPAHRCSEEFEALFECRYRTEFGAGMVVSPNKTRITASYKPASASFGEPIAAMIGDLPDITALTAPVRRLQKIAEGCVEDLESYSRMIGREPGARGSLQAIALLPAELAARQDSDQAARVREWLVRALADGDAATVKGEDLLRLWGAQNTKLSKADAVLLAQFLQKLGYGIEPDVRFGGGPPAAESGAVLFRLPTDAPATPSSDYQAAAILLHLAAAVAQADGRVDGAEEALLIGHLEEALRLQKPERVRLAAHLRWVLANPVGLGGIKKQASSLDDARRVAVAQFLVAVAGADGRIEPAEVKALGKIYALFSLDASRLYADLHDLGSEDQDVGPVTVQTASTAPSGFRIPSGSPVSAAVVLDAERVRRKMVETAAVGVLLRGVFVDDSAPVAAVMASSPSPSDAQAEFLRVLAARSSWPRAELEAEAARLHILLDGALEMVNERAFDSCGEPACEGDDPVEVHADVLKELLG